MTDDYTPGLIESLCALLCGFFSLNRDKRDLHPFADGASDSVEHGQRMPFIIGIF